MQEHLMHICAWCTREIPPDEEVFGFGAKVREDVDLSDKEGEFVSLSLALANRTVAAIVPPEDSPARQAGYGLMFITCSQACAEDLKAALDMEKDVFEDFRG